MVNAPNIVDEVDTLIPIFHQFRAKFNKCKFHTRMILQRTILIVDKQQVRNWWTGFAEKPEPRCEKVSIMRQRSQCHAT